MQQQQQGLDIDKLQQAVKARWLKPQEVLKILQNHELFMISHKTPQKPKSGSWFLFNRRVLRYFRNDGHEWQKKKNGRTIKEAHERLKVDNVDVLNCYYARGDKNLAFQRRIYWMLDPVYDHIVLVHYRDVLEGGISVSARNDSSAAASSLTSASESDWMELGTNIMQDLKAMQEYPSVSSLTSASGSDWMEPGTKRMPDPKAIQEYPSVSSLTSASQSDWMEPGTKRMTDPKAMQEYPRMEVSSITSASESYWMEPGTKRMSDPKAMQECPRMEVSSLTSASESDWMEPGTKRIPDPKAMQEYPRMEVSSLTSASESDWMEPGTKRMSDPKEMQEYPRMLKRYQQTKVEVVVEEPYSTSYKDVMAWFAMGKQRQKGLGHTCMKQADHKLLGRDDIRQKVMENILLDRNVGSDCTVICISGGSGFGKTSLLHVLYNDQELIDAFDKRIWIQISDKLDILMLFRKIIEFSMNDHCSIMNIDLLRELVIEEITDKKFLLFLDDADIQDQQCWTSILEVLNTGAKDSAVVMATSSTNDVLRDVATHSYFLNPLPEESNMMILQQYSGVGTNIQSNPDLVMIAKRFISRFGSNPLNLKSICGLLCHAGTISLDKDEFEGSVMPLQLCHDVLPSHMKKCLAFCSLFPEGYIFDKHHTVRQWISHGCVRTLEGYDLEDVGLEYFSEFLCRSFFQPSPIHNDHDHKFVMHELMYRLVESVGRDRYFKYKNPVSSMPESILHLSFVASQFRTVKLMSITEELKDLQTFLVVQPEWKAYNISFPTSKIVGLDEFFLKFTSLETLDLSHTDIEELPGSIVRLRNLRYLSVNSTNVRALPSELCSLSNLQTLEVKNCCFLTELPGDIKKLVKLCHLDLTKELGYIHLPWGIGELTELQTLPVFHVSGDLSRCSISELGTLHNLRGCLWLSGLESVKTGSKAQEASLKNKHHLKDLTLQWHDDGIDTEDEDKEDAENVADEQVLESLQPHASLQVLSIRGYKGSRFPAWMQGSSSSLPNLVTLTLDSCCNCTEFPAIAQLPSLKSLSVRKMYNVQRLSSNPHGDGTAKFRSLELLNLWEMYGLEELFFEDSEGYCPRLRKVCISRCPGLKMLPRTTPVTELVLHCGHQLPDISELVSLVSLKIEGFHSTKSFRLPPAAALRKLEIRSCKELSSVDGLSTLTTVRSLKIAGCPRLILPGTSRLMT